MVVQSSSKSNGSPYSAQTMHLTCRPIQSLRLSYCPHSILSYLFMMLSSSGIRIPFKITNLHIWRCRWSTISGTTSFSEWEVIGGEWWEGRSGVVREARRENIWYVLLSARKPTGRRPLRLINRPVIGQFRETPSKFYVVRPLILSRHDVIAERSLQLSERNESWI